MLLQACVAIDKKKLTKIQLVCLQTDIKRVCARAPWLRLFSLITTQRLLSIVYCPRKATFDLGVGVPASDPAGAVVFGLFSRVLVKGDHLKIIS